MMPINKLVQYPIWPIPGPSTKPITYQDGLLIQFLEFDNKIIGIVQTQDNRFIAVPIYDLKVVGQ